MIKIKLSRKTIKIKIIKKTQYLEVTAWVFNDLLAWHKNVSGQWTLTHVETGYKLADYHGKYNQLRKITRDLSSLSDWQTTDHDHEKLTSLALLCDEIIRSYEQ